jgi:hypothetical protein
MQKVLTAVRSPGSLAAVLMSRLKAIQPWVNVYN